ncbi:uncharacterized [Tachysurus ichikawai]
MAGSCWLSSENTQQIDSPLSLQRTGAHTNRPELGDVPEARSHRWHVCEAEGQVTLQHQKGNREFSLPEQPDGGVGFKRVGVDCTKGGLWVVGPSCSLPRNKNANLANSPVDRLYGKQSVRRDKGVGDPAESSSSPSPNDQWSMEGQESKGQGWSLSSRAVEQRMKRGTE